MRILRNWIWTLAIAIEGCVLADALSSPVFGAIVRWSILDWYLLAASIVCACALGWRLADSDEDLNRARF